MQMTKRAKRRIPTLTLGFYLLFAVHTALLQPVWCIKGGDAPALEMATVDLRCVCGTVSHDDHHHGQGERRCGDVLSPPLCCTDTPAAGLWWVQQVGDTIESGEGLIRCGHLEALPPHFGTEDASLQHRFLIHPLSKFLLRAFHRPASPVLLC